MAKVSMSDKWCRKSIAYWLLTVNNKEFCVKIATIENFNASTVLQIKKGAMTKMSLNNINMKKQKRLI